MVTKIMLLFAKATCPHRFLPVPGSLAGFRGRDPGVGNGMEGDVKGARME